MRFIQFSFMIISLILWLNGPIAAQDTATGRSPDTSIEHTVPFALKFYQKHISGISGDRCRMYPSCSHYSSQAFAEHGWLKGWIMTCDRLMRCSRDEVTLSPPVVVNGRWHTHDPLDNNDIWKEKTSCCPLPPSAR